MAKTAQPGTSPCYPPDSESPSMTYIALKTHRSEFPDPITFTKGTLLIIGEKVDGPESWNNWYFCSTPDKQEGRGPAQVIKWLESGMGKAIEDDTAKELDISPGDVLSASKTLNGWAWCHRASDGQSGWVPLEILQEAGN